MADNKVIDKDETDVYSFGVQLLSETVFSFVVFLMIAALFGSVTEFIIFTVAFALIRQYGGGFHASKFIYCLLISCGIVTLFCLLIRFTEPGAEHIAALSTVSVPIILILSPVDSKYKPIANEDKKKYRNKLFVFLGVEVFAAIITAFISLHFSMCIVLSWCALSGLMVVGDLINKKHSGGDIVNK